MRHRSTILAGLSLIVLTVIPGIGCSRPAAPAAVDDEALAELLGEPRRDLGTAVYNAKRDWIATLLEQAKTSPPTSEEANDLFELVRRDPDFRVKVRAMAVLPFVPERERAIDVLIGALKDRDPESSGSGNVPSYATRYLAEMNAGRAIPAIEDWIAFLDGQKPKSEIEREMHTTMLETARKRVAALRAGDPAAH